jgi:hypothetical protein
VRVHLAREHALELEQLELLGDALDLADDVGERARVLLFARELLELVGFVERFRDAVESGDYGFELGALAA